MNAQSHSAGRHVFRVIVAGVFCAAAVHGEAQVPAATGSGLTLQAPIPLANPQNTGIDRFRALTVQQPNNAEGWIALGIALYGSGQARSSIDALTRGLALRPDDTRASTFLALVQADTGACDAAVPVLRHSLASEAQGPQRLSKIVGLSLMTCLSFIDKPLEALSVSADLQAKMPDDADVLYASAELYTRLWTETAGRLASTHPGSFRVHQLAGEVYEAQGNYDQAIREYRAALAENSSVPGLRFRLGQVLLRKGGETANDEASLEFRGELATNPQSAVSALALAEIERHGNRLQAAAADYRLALGIDPALAAARVGLGQVLLAQDDTAGARKEVDEALRTHPDDAEAHYVSMLAYRKAGDRQRAAQEMETFRQLQAAKQTQFNRTLDALLSGKQSGSAAAPGQAPNAAGTQP